MTAAGLWEERRGQGDDVVGVKTLSATADGLSSIPGIHVVKRENCESFCEFN